MPQPHETELARLETFFDRELTLPLLEHPAKPLSARRLRQGRSQDRLGSGGRYGDLGACYRALRDFGGFSWLSLVKRDGGFVLQDQRNIGHLLYPTPVRLGAWEGKPGLLALVLGEEESRWVSFYRPKQGKVRLASVDWELRGGSGIGRFFFDQQPRFQVWTGSPPEVAVEAICSPRGDLDFVSPVGYFEGTQIAFSEAGDWAEVAFGKSNRAKTICWSDTSLHTFESGGTGTTTVEVTNKGFKYVGFTVMVRDTSKNIRLAIEVLIGKRDFSPQLILKRVLFNPQKLGELVDIAGK